MATITANISASETVIPTSEELEIGHYTIDSENIYVTGNSRGAEGRAFNRLFASVNRAVGGSTAATHTSGATLTRYYPDASTTPGGGGVTVDNGTDPPEEVMTLVAPGADLSTPGVADVSSYIRQDSNGTVIIDAPISGAEAFRITSDFEGDPITVYEVANSGGLFIASDDKAVDSLFIEPVEEQNIGRSLAVFRAPEVSNRVWITRHAYIKIQAAAAPDDAELAANQCAFWFDPTDLTPKLMIKGKSANGTVVTGEVALT